MFSSVPQGQTFPLGTQITSDFDFGGRTVRRQSWGGSPQFVVPQGANVVIKNLVLDAAGDDWRPSMYNVNNVCNMLAVYGTCTLENVVLRNGVPSDPYPLPRGNRVLRYWEFKSDRFDSTYQVEGSVSVGWLNSNIPNPEDGRVHRHSAPGGYDVVFFADGGQWYQPCQSEIVWVYDGGHLRVESGCRVEDIGYNALRCGNGGVMIVDGLTAQDAYRAINSSGNSDITVRNSNFHDAGLLWAGGGAYPNAVGVCENVNVYRTTRLSHYKQSLGKVEDHLSFQATNFTLHVDYDLETYAYAIRRTKTVDLDQVDFPTWTSCGAAPAATWTVNNSVFGNKSPVFSPTSSALYAFAKDTIFIANNTTFRGLTGTPIKYVTSTSGGGDPDTLPSLTNCTIEGGYGAYSVI